MRFLPFLFLVLLQPLSVHAHEVYVLPREVIEEAVRTPAFSLIDVALTNLSPFLLWTGIAIGIVVLIFFISISRTIEGIFDPFLKKISLYAPTISRITVGLSFIAASYHHAVFGPELPLHDTFGGAASLITGVLLVIGIMITIGWYTRIAAALALIIFFAEVFKNGWYMLTYANYMGELLLLIILGAHHIGIHHRGHDLTAHRLIRVWKARLAPYAFPILRVLFGVSLLYASLYAKVFHNQLVLEVTKAYPDIVAFFGFEPHFLILGAAILEIVIGLFFILGIEIRFTSLFVLFWLSLSLWYFGEAVWPHIILIGIPVAFIFYGYDKYSLEGYFYKRNGREPVL
mgnify:CR=1 FL=1